MQNQSNSEASTKNLMTIGEASNYLGVSIDTLRRWEVRGRVTPLRSPGGHRYYTKDDLDGLFNKKYVRDEFSKKQIEEPLPKEAKTEPDLVTLASTPSTEMPKVEEEKPTTLPVVEETIPSFPIESQKKEKPFQDSLNQNTQEPTPISILEPISKKSPTPIPIPQVAIPENTQNQRIQDILGKKKEDKMSKSEVILIISVFLFVILDVVLFLYWFSSTKIVAPIP